MKSFVFALLLLLVSFEARAEAVGRVLLLSSPGEEIGVAAQRLQAELTVSGFEVESRRFSGDNLKGFTESVGLGSDTVSAITILRQGQAFVADVWIADSTNGRTVGRRIEASTPEQLSVRAVEALRAGLLEISLGPGAPQTVPVPKRSSPEPVEVLPTSPPPRWRASTGAAFLVASDGIGGAAGPMFRLSGLLTGHWWLGASLLAPIWGGGAPGVPFGQAIAKAELTYIYPVAPSVILTPSVGAGMYGIGHGGVEGVRADYMVVGLANLALGAGAYISESAYLLLDFQALFFAPTPKVLVRNFDRTGPTVPAFVGTLGLNAEF